MCDDSKGIIGAELLQLPGLGSGLGQSYRYAAEQREDRTILVTTRLSVMAAVNEESMSSPAVATAYTPERSAESRKRSLSGSGDERESLPPAKRQHVDMMGLQSPPAEEGEENYIAVVDTKASFDDEVSLLLKRSISTVLKGVGFDGASKEALEAIHGEVDSYATNFLSLVSESMLSSRRSRTTPIDFEYALRREGLTAMLLTPHLNPPVPAGSTNLHFNLQEPEEAPYQPVATLLGAELSGTPEKERQKYIPRKFPTFPSLHTFKSTEVKPERETDPRKIREKATEAARHGEEALRRLVKVGKAGDQRGAKKISEKNPKHKLRHELWEQTMAALTSEDGNKPLASNEDATEEQYILINAEKQYGRRPVTKVKKEGIVKGLKTG